MAAPSKKTPDRIASILASLAIGKSLRAACADHDLLHETWYDWEKSDADLLAARRIAVSRGLSVLEGRVLTTTDPVEAKVILHRLGKLDKPEWGTEQTITHEGMTLAAAVKARQDADVGG